MTYKPTTNSSNRNPRGRSDADRLRSADQALALIEDDIRGLTADGDDLAYLIDVLRVGVQRALDANSKAHSEIRVPVLSESTH